MRPRTTGGHEKEISTANGEVELRGLDVDDGALKSECKEGGRQAGTGDAIRTTDITDPDRRPDKQDGVNLPSPQLEALLNALDDVTDEASCSEVVSHCAEVAKHLTDDEKATLRAKVSATRARLAYRTSGGKVTLIPFTNASQTAWRFPDGTTETSSWKAEQRARALNMRLEERQRGRFSESH